MSKPPLLLLSSGSRPRYLEDVVRALALLDGGHIQFRYENKLVASGVRAHLGERGLVGHTCYLAYLDNRTAGKKPEIVPLREAEVLEASERGSSIILRLAARRYIRTNELSRLQHFFERSATKSPRGRRTMRSIPKNPFRATG